MNLMKNASMHSPVRASMAGLLMAQWLGVIVWYTIAFDFDIKIYINRKQISCLTQKYTTEMWQRNPKISKY